MQKLIKFNFNQFVLQELFRSSAGRYSCPVCTSHSLQKHPQICWSEPGAVTGQAKISYQMNSPATQTQALEDAEILEEDPQIQESLFPVPIFQHWLCELSF